MGIIAQKSIFCWKDLQNIGDLQRLKYVLENIPDARLIKKLYELRAKGRNDCEIEPMWNSILAGVIFQHSSIESLRRELLRNERLRQMCGFEPLIEAERCVPDAWNYSRFLKNLMKCSNEVNMMFDDLVKQVQELLSDFGKVLAHDGKAVQTYAKQKKEGYKKMDGRRDIDANIGIKEYSGVDENGRAWKVIKSWFGYKLHLIIDAKYELPVSYEVTKASEAETPIAHKMLNKLNESNPEILKKAEYFTSDKGNDDEKLITKLWKEHKIKPVIDIRNMWKDPDKTKGLASGLNAVYNYKGDVFCVCEKTGEIKSMAYGGYEKDRSALRYRCPAIHYGEDCKCMGTCKIYNKKYLRISLKENRRIFTPLARSSYKWKKIYNMRTSVERVNSRIDNVFCFEKHFIRGLTKMKLRLGVAFCVMLAMAIGKIKDNKVESLSCFTKTA